MTAAWDDPSLIFVYFSPSSCNLTIVLMLGNVEFYMDIWAQLILSLFLLYFCIIRYHKHMSTSGTEINLDLKQRFYKAWNVKVNLVIIFTGLFWKYQFPISENIPLSFCVGYFLEVSVSFLPELILNFNFKWLIPKLL